MMKVEHPPDSKERQQVLLWSASLSRVSPVGFTSQRSLCTLHNMARVA